MAGYGSWYVRDGGGNLRRLKHAWVRDASGNLRWVDKLKVCKSSDDWGSVSLARRCAVTVTSSASQLDIWPLIAVQIPQLLGHSIAVDLTINSGVTLSSSSADVPALYSSVELPPGSRITITNNGYIVGANGAGGAGGTHDGNALATPDTENPNFYQAIPDGSGGWTVARNTYDVGLAGSPGAPGGPAISLPAECIMYNNGDIFGGGGGGGGGSGTKFVSGWLGTLLLGGGGGGGYNGGGGGQGFFGSTFIPVDPGFNPAYNGNPGQNASSFGGSSVSGGGGPHYSDYGGFYAADHAVTGCRGGASGVAGGPGSAGSNSYSTSGFVTYVLTAAGGAGGAVGSSVQTNGFGIQWITGDNSTQTKGLVV